MVVHPYETVWVRICLIGVTFAEHFRYFNTSCHLTVTLIFTIIEYEPIDNVLLMAHDLEALAYAVGWKHFLRELIRRPVGA